MFPILLFSLTNHELLWKYVDWILEKDEELGIKVSVFILFVINKVTYLYPRN